MTEVKTSNRKFNVLLLLLLFLNGAFSRQVISEYTGPIFTKFSALVDLWEEWEGLINSTFFFTIAEGTLPWQPILGAKLAYPPSLVTLTF